jgi:hypothetical protein
MKVGRDVYVVGGLCNTSTRMREVVIWAMLLWIDYHDLNLMKLFHRYMRPSL